MPFNKPDITQLSSLGSTVGDVYFPQTKLLLPFDGSNGATTTSDLSDSNHSFTFSGGVQLTTAQSKFGGSCIYFDGSDDYIYTSDSSSFTVGSSDFTFDFWLKRTSTGTAREGIWGQSNSGGSTLSYFCQFSSGSVTDAKLRFGICDTGSTFYYCVSNSAITDTNWRHIAFVKHSGVLTMYIDGTAQTTTASVAFTVKDVSENFNIGRVWHGNYFNGYIDDFRFTNGVARYTANFTAPTTTHLTSAGDVNKQILINSAADGVAVGTGGINQARIAKTWVNFNGSGTVAIRDSYNVGSITDNGTGTYTVNFSTAMTNANYCCNMNSGDKAVVWGIPLFDGTSTFLAGSCRIVMQNPSDQPQDNPIVCASFFGN